MRKCIRDVLNCDSFKNTVLLAGAAGIDHEVGGATLMEVPDIFPYLEKDFLLITTLYPIANNTEQLQEFIPRLVESQVAGICIKPMRYVSEIPDFMLKQADALCFPLIELPPDANLSTLVNAVYSMSLNDYIAQLQFRDNVHQSLMEQLLGGASVDALAVKLAQLLDNAVILLNKSLTPICCVLADDQGNWVLHDQQKTKDLMVSREFLNRQYEMYPVKAGANNFGYIFLPDASKDNSNLKMAVEQAAMLFAALYFKNDAVVQNQRNFKDVFIRDLLQGKITSEMELDNKMRAFDLHISFPQYVVCLELFTDNELRKKRFYNDIIRERFIDKQLSYFFEGVHDKNIVYFNDALVILEQGKGETELLDFYRSISGKLAAQAGADTYVGIGISKAATCFEQLAQSYAQAVNTVRLGSQLHCDTFVRLYSQSKIYEIIQQVGDVELLRTFVADKLGGLLEYDQANGSDLLETLQMLIAENLHYKRAAEKLFVHYNTVRYRAGKIQQLGVPLEPGRQLGEVTLAIDIYIWLKAIKEF